MHKQQQPHRPSRHKCKYVTCRATLRYENKKSTTITTPTKVTKRCSRENMPTMHARLHREQKVCRPYSRIYAAASKARYRQGGSHAPPPRAPVRPHKYKYVTCHAAALKRETHNDNNTNEQREPKRCSREPCRPPHARIRSDRYAHTQTTQPPQAKQNMSRNQMNTRNKRRPGEAKRYEGTRREKEAGEERTCTKARREPRATTKGTRAPMQATRPGMENTNAQGRRQRKNHKSRNKQVGRQKPRRRRDRAGNGGNTRHNTHPAHKNTKEPPPTPPDTVSPPQGASWRAKVHNKSHRDRDGVKETKNGHARRSRQHRGKKNGWYECIPTRRNTHIQEEQEVFQVPTSKSKECDKQEQARQRHLVTL